MKYIKQEIIEFTASNITEPVFNIYDPAKTYNLVADADLYNDDTGMCIYGNYYYRSVINNNLGNNPEETLNDKWVKYGITNQKAMIDLKSQTKSVLDGDIVVKFKRNQIDTIGIGNTDSSKIEVRHFDSSNVEMTEYYQEFNMSVNDDVYDVISYTYSDYTAPLQRGVKIDIFSGSYYVEITLVRPNQTDNTTCGYMIGGSYTNMGDTLSEVGFNFNSFAIKEFDDFGSLNIIKRNVQDLVDFETIVDSELTMLMKYKIKEVYNEVVLFVVDPSDNSQYENMLTLGIIENASVITSLPTKSYISWSVIESI